MTTTYIKPTNTWTMEDYSDYAEEFLKLKQSVNYNKYKKIKISCQKARELGKDYDILEYEDIPTPFFDNGLIREEEKKINVKYHNYKFSQYILKAEYIDQDTLQLRILDKKKTSEILAQLVSSDPYEILYFILENIRWINSVESDSFDLISDFLYI